MYKRPSIFNIRMMPSFPLLLRGWLRLLWLPVWLLALPAHAGSISFSLSLNDDQLTLVNQGDTPAFYPVVYRLTAHGQWQPLQLAPGTTAPVEMQARAQFNAVWPDRRPLASLTPLEALQPVMVRFFDQAGVSFGQISFFNQPLNASEELRLQAGYVDGRLIIKPPKTPGIEVTWLLWAQEDGILPLTRPVQPEHRQPDAKRIAWQPKMGQESLDLGKGMPVAFLLHQTREGFYSQVVARGRLQGRQQRSAWLDAHMQFYWAARLALAAATGLLLWHFIAGWRNRNVK